MLTEYLADKTIFHHMYILYESHPKSNSSNALEMQWPKRLPKKKKKKKKGTNTKKKRNEKKKKKL